ncbi:hypothetical protein K504DRAFT_458730 [Pleomassaria siparia CBS 279.74]|uniref:Uncharacterized protein n=1 Tax=Pleomassaria siparia CBS 279.74 TaxID=1314801 RepID=A0A6G1K3A9_9PLEO|nr:hypothetical protein K504DRAFT_458730 [Pleomassaria siparia CBS 279.74]
MASTDPTPVMTFLRQTTLATYPFAFVLGIAHAATASNGLFPAISLVPQTASALLSALVLHLDSQRRNKVAAHSRHGLAVNHGEDKRRKTRNIMTFAGDFSVFATLLTCLIFSWIELSKYNSYWDHPNSSETMLGTYATVPFMTNMTIHLFFCLRTLYLSLPKSFFSIFAPYAAPKSCPNCHHNLASVGPVERWQGDKNPGGYSFLNPDESDSLYRDIERQTGTSMERESTETAREAEGEFSAPRKVSEETATEISEQAMAKMLGV